MHGIIYPVPQFSHMLCTFAHWWTVEFPFLFFVTFFSFLLDNNVFPRGVGSGEWVRFHWGWCQNSISVWIQINLAFAFCVLCFSLSLFFFFLFGLQLLTSQLWTCIVHETHKMTLFSNFFIKNGSHSTIYTFKNYFFTVFLVSAKISCIQTDRVARFIKLLLLLILLWIMFICFFFF